MKANFYIVIFLFSIMAFGQIEHESCLSDIMNERMLRENPELRAELAQFEELWQKIQRGESDFLNKSIIENGETIYEIPVVVHVIHTGNPVGGQYNKSDQEIIDWVQRANDVYSTVADDIDGPENGGAVIPVRFVLAKRTEDCQATNGIVRVNGSQALGSLYTNSGVRSGSNGSGVTQDQIRELSRWNSEMYYNIYIINKFNGSNGEAGGLMGFAYFPFNSGVDGAYMVSAVVRNNDTTFAHEFGHAAHLYHPFHRTDGYNSCPPNNDCTKDNDKVCDTEPTISLISSCPSPSSTNSCTNQPYQGVQYNVMNYSPCPRRFTVGQRNRMMASIFAKRSKLINSMGGKAPQTLLNPPAEICSPTTISKPGNYNMGPTLVSFGHILNESSGYDEWNPQFYENYISNCLLNPNVTAEFYRGHTYTLEVGVDTNYQKVVAYIDFNGNGAFDETTEKLLNQNVAPDSSVKLSVTIPNDADISKPVRMRVMADFEGRNMTACDNPYYGQVEDYAVTIKDKTPASNWQYNKGVGINTDNPQATLDIHSSNSGVLFPRMTQAQINNIQNPVHGMMVYNLTAHCLAVYVTGTVPGWKCIKTKNINL